MLRIDLIVHLRRDQILVLVSNQSIESSPAGIRGRWNCLQDVQSYRAEQVGRNLVAGAESKGCRQRGFDGAEVPQRHGGGRNKGGVLGTVRAKGGPLVTAKEEQLIFPDRPANHTSELV